MGFLSKAFKSVMRGTKALYSVGLSENRERAKDKAKSEARNAANQLQAQQQAARDIAAGEAGGTLKRRQALRQASLLGSYDPSESSSLLG